MTTTHHRTVQRRRLDFAGLALLLIGIVFGAVAYVLISVSSFNALIIVPSVVAVTLGATHLIKKEAPRA